MKTNALLVSTLLLTAASSAQGSIVSPTVAATAEGAGTNSFPFTSTTVRRYMQIHGDLGAVPRSFKTLRFRPNAPASATTYSGVGAIDCELFLGHSYGVENASFFIDKNYASPRTSVMARKIVNFGPQGLVSPPGPNPFDNSTSLVFDAPFLFLGSKAIAWEVVVYSNTFASGADGLDVDSGTMTAGVSAITGAGCTATGQTAAMTHTFTAQDIGGILAMNFTVTAGPAGQQALAGIGVTNPNVSGFGLCAPLYTDAILQLPIGPLSAAGAITTTEAGAASIVLKNSPAFTGVPLYTQVFAADIGRTDPIPVAASNGRSIPMPAPGLSKVVNVARIFNNAGGTTATQAIFFATSAIGYGVVTEFVY